MNVRSAMDNNSNRIELHAIIHGDVQGVWFRATTMHYAQQLKLEGIVRNCPDGTVEMFVQGEQKELEMLLAQLRVSHRITSIDTEFASPTKSYTGFKISH
jgi:acylphosphatase